MVRKSVLCFIVWASALSSSARDIPECVRVKLDSMIDDGLKCRAFPGASLVVGDRDGICYARHYGCHDYSGKRPVADGDLFDVASCTKVLSTTFAVMRLYDQGKLKVMEAVGRYLPELAATPVGGISLRELLTHTSGLRAQVFYTPLVRNAAGGSMFSGKRTAAYPHQVGKNYYVAGEIAYDTAYLCSASRPGWRQAADDLYVNPAVDTLILGQIVRDYKPARRGSYLYSDTNFLLLKMIVERVSGRPLDELTRELFAELDCTDTYYNPLQYRDKRNCLPTETDYILGRGTVQGYVHDELGALMGGVGGNAGLFTTACDMARFCEMILGGGTYAGRQVLTRKTVELFTESPYTEQGVWRGLGFDKRDPKTGELGGETRFGHTGFTGTIFWMDSRTGVYMVFLTNAVHPTRVNNKLNASMLRTKIWETLCCMPDSSGSF